MYFIDVKNTHECYMKFYNVRVSLTVGDIGMKSVTYMYIGTNSSRGVRNWYQFFAA